MLCKSAPMFTDKDIWKGKPNGEAVTNTVLLMLSSPCEHGNDAFYCLGELLTTCFSSEKLFNTQA